MPARPIAGGPPRALATLVALAAVLAGCGEDEPTQAGGTPLTITDEARASFDLMVDALDIDFDRDHYDVDAATETVTIGYAQKGQIIHSLLINDAGGNQVPITQTGGQVLQIERGPEGRLIVGPGIDVSGTAELPPGDYALICDIPGHAEAGMTATMTVQ